MAIDNSLESLLETLTASIRSASEALPKDDGVITPKDGVSLLDVKNELLLSYLHNLMFLILLKIRSQSRSDTSKVSHNDTSLQLQEDVVKKLVELRLYLERGVRPLENRLKYQFDKIVRAAEDAARKADHRRLPVGEPKKAKRLRSLNSDFNSKGASDAGTSDSAGSDEEEGNETSHGPNAANFRREKASGPRDADARGKDGIYRPPKFTPVSMPTSDGREERQARKPTKSSTLDEFVANELSGAPVTQPSIGSTIVAGGRRLKSERDRREEAEKRDYEESNFIRLPKQSKKEQAKQRRRQTGGFGGEEWRGIGAGLDRIERLTQRKGGSLSTLERSRKRPIGDDRRSAGSSIGDAFEKRRKIVARRK